MATAVRIERVAYALHAKAIHAVRDQVFIMEQRVPVAVEHDDRDPCCIHVLAWQDKLPVATGRLDIEKGGKIGRVAVLKAQRGAKLGEGVMRALENAARQQGLTHVRLHAQQHACQFYQRLGYQQEGLPFVEADIVHVAMTKPLV